MARCARQYDITHGQIPILYSHTFSRPAEGPSLLSHFTFLQFLLWFKSSVRLDVRSFYPLHAGDEALRAQRAEERAGARSTGLVVVTIEDYLAGARALCLRTAHRPAHCAPSSPEPRRAIVTTSTPLCCAPAQMLGSLDQDLLGHVLLRLQLVDILAVFAFDRKRRLSIRQPLPSILRRGLASQQPELPVEGGGEGAARASLDEVNHDEMTAMQAQERAPVAIILCYMPSACGSWYQKRTV